MPYFRKGIVFVFCSKFGGLYSFKFNALALKCVADNVRNIFISQKQRETSLLDVPRASCCRFQDGDCIAKNFLLKVNVTGKSENDTDSCIGKQKNRDSWL